MMKSLEWKEGKLILLDQRKLPEEILYMTCSNYREVDEAIRTLTVRGAPAIGVAAAYAMVLAADEIRKSELPKSERFKEQFIGAGDFIKSARPTAVNLSWAVDEMIKIFNQSETNDIYENLLKKAGEIEKQDKQICSDISSFGADLFKNRKNLKILTHCNACLLYTSPSPRD